MMNGKSKTSHAGVSLHLYVDFPTYPGIADDRQSMFAFSSEGIGEFLAIPLQFYESVEVALCLEISGMPLES